MIIDQWARKWDINLQATEDLKTMLGVQATSVDLKETLSEAGVQSRVRLEASQKGCRLWRNNVGAIHLPDGNFIRYGLANDSSALNRQIKSADLIGIRPIKIQPSHIGCTIGQFVSREVKATGWRYRATEREQAQLRWAELILALGGDACFTTGTGTL